MFCFYTGMRSHCGCPYKPGLGEVGFGHHDIQGRLLHINDGANAPWKK